MKKYIKRITSCLSALMFLATLGLAAKKIEGGKVEVKAETTGQTFNSSDVVLKFAAVTDTHVGYASNDVIFDNTLTVLQQFAGQGGLDAFVTAGDNTQDGKDAQVQSFMEVYRKHFDPSKTPTIITHGNHDSYWSGCMTLEEFYNSYGPDVYTFDEDHDSAKKGNRHVVVNGYHFITVQIQTFMPNYNNLSAETTTWLKNTLKSAAEDDPNKPIFVACHSPQLNTIYGSCTTNNGIDPSTGEWGASKDFNNILNNYPQSVLISGHTHYANNDERAIYQDGYTSFTPGGASDISADKDTVETSNGAAPNARSRSQGTIVEVDSDNNMRITRIDFVKKQQIKNYWIVPAPKADKSHLNYYTAERAEKNLAPFFGSKADIQIVSPSTDKLRVYYSKGLDDDMVYSYNISLKNAKGTTLATVNTLAPWLDYPNLNDIPDTLSYTFAGVTPTYPLTVEIKAKDSYGKESTTFTKTFEDPAVLDAKYAGEFDEKVNALGEINENSASVLQALRQEYSLMSYSRRAKVKTYSTFKAKENEFYNNYALSEEETNNAVAVADCFNLIPSTSRGTLTANGKCGVDINWTGATKNNIIGVNKTYNLDKLKMYFGGVELSGDDKTIGFILSSQAKDKYTSNENLLITIDFEEGAVNLVSNGKNVMLGNNECLKYENMACRPFSITFNKTENGYKMTVEVYGYDKCAFNIGTSYITGTEHLTNENSVYCSITPWAKSVQGSINLRAVCQTKETSPDDSGETSEKGKKGGCSSSVISLLGVISLSAIALQTLKKKEN